MPYEVKTLRVALLAVIEDAREAEAFLDAKDTPFARRVYIRTCFATLEGVVWILKDLCVSIKGDAPIPVGEYGLLKDQAYELKANGEVVEQTKFLRLPENVKFTFRVFNRTLSANIDLGIGGAGWCAFMSSLGIRHRLMHPKKVTDVEVTDQEIEDCKRAIGWFNTVLVEVLKVVSAKATRRTGSGAG